MANLADGRGRTISELGRAVGVRPTTLTSVLDRLEQRGHITRGTRAGDRRVVVVELTSDGRRAATVVRESITRIEHRALGSLPANEMAVLRQALKALAGMSS